MQHQPKNTIKDIEAYLSRQSKEALVALLMEQVKKDDAMQLIWAQFVESKINYLSAYEQAAQYVAKVRDLMKRLGRDTEFNTYLERIRKAHKPKRNFMALLDQMI